MKFSSFIFGAVVCLTGMICLSCSTYVPVTRAYPPEILLKKDEGTFLFVNRFDPEQHQFLPEMRSAIEKGVKRYLQGIVYGFSLQPDYTLLMADTVLLPSDQFNPAATLQPSQVESWCKYYNADYFLTLDLFETNFEKDRDGKTIYHKIIVATYTTLYDAQGTIIKKQRDHQSVKLGFNILKKGEESRGPLYGGSPRKVEEKLEFTGNIIGIRYITNFSYLFEQKETIFFLGKNFKDVYKAYKQREWFEAELLLKPLITHEDEKISGKATYNMAVIMQNQYLTRAADYWYQIAAEKLGDKVPPKP